jgi:hypothetical protein
MVFQGDIAGDSMFLFFQTRCLVALCALAAPVVFAQVEEARTTTGSADRTPAVTSLEFTSSFANYQAFTDQPVLPWREANDTVRQIGGWRAYAREALQAEPVTAPAPATAGAKP